MSFAELMTLFTLGSVGLLLLWLAAWLIFREYFRSKERYLERTLQQIDRQETEDE